MKTFIQTALDFIQTSETHTDGSYTSGIIRRFETKTRQVQDGTEEVYSPWDELDPNLVTWLDMPAFKASQAAAATLANFKATRETSIQTKAVNANGHMFHADFWSKTQMSEAIAVLWEDGAQDTDIIQWSLYGTPSGYMTDVTLADLKLARKLAQVNVSAVWGLTEV
jgi:hypothetical protein